MTESAKLRIPLIAGSQAQKHVTHNEAMTLLDTLVQLSVLDRDLAAPPADPAEGDAYIVAGEAGDGTASGAWTGWEARVARFIDGAWRSYPPGEGEGRGWLAWVMDEDAMVRFDGTRWELAGIEGPQGPQGPEGPQGPAGPTGPAGASALTITRAVATSGVDIAGGGLAAGQLIDGVTLAEGDRILVAAQADAAENGVYLAPASGGAARDPAFNTYDAHPGVYFSVLEGVTAADTLWRCTSDRGGTLGTDAIVIEAFTAGSGGNSAPPMNWLINGGFDLWQRGTSLAGGGYWADRWRGEIGGGATVSRQSFALGQADVPGEPRHFLRHDRTSADASANTVLEQRIEGVRALAGRTVTATLWLKAAASKTFEIDLVQHFGTGGSPSADVIVTAQSVAVTTAWQKFSLAFDAPSLAGKTLGSDGNDYLSLRIREAAGFGTFTLDVARASVVAGDITGFSDPFEERQIETEITRAQRYYRKSYPIDSAPGAITRVGSVGFHTPATDSFHYVTDQSWEVPMRGSPTVTVYNPDTGSTALPIRNTSQGTDHPATVDQIGTKGFFCFVNNSSIGGGRRILTQFTCDAEL